MTIQDPVFQEYISGKRFHPNFPIEFSLDLRVKNRDAILADIVRGKSIVHVGCVDHLDIIESKISAGTWLHKILMDSSKRCLGIDINLDGIEYLRKNHNITDLIATDLTNEKIDEIADHHWDYILLPEVIEHIPDHVAFISAIKDKYSKNIDKMIITVPNLFSYSLFQGASRNIEQINTDHRHWFSPYTLVKTLNDAGVIVEELHLINGFWGPYYCNIKERITNRLLEAFKMKRDFKKVKDMRYAKGLLVIAR